MYLVIQIDRISHFAQKIFCLKIQKNILSVIRYNFALIQF